MELIKLGKKGQVTIPRNVLRKVGVRGEGQFLVSTTRNGGILLRPAGVYPIEIYTEERISEFAEANEVPQTLVEETRKRAASQSRR